MTLRQASERGFRTQAHQASESSLQQKKSSMKFLDGNLRPVIFCNLPPAGRTLSEVDSILRPLPRKPSGYNFRRRAKWLDFPPKISKNAAGLKKRRSLFRVISGFMTIMGRKIMEILTIQRILMFSCVLQCATSATRPTLAWPRI